MTLTKTRLQCAAALPKPTATKINFMTLSCSLTEINADGLCQMFLKLMMCFNCDAQRHLRQSA